MRRVVFPVLALVALPGAQSILGANSDDAAPEARTFLHQGQYRSSATPAADVDRYLLG